MKIANCSCLVLLFCVAAVLAGCTAPGKTIATNGNELTPMAGEVASTGWTRALPGDEL